MRSSVQQAGMACSSQWDLNTVIISNPKATVFLQRLDHEATRALTDRSPDVKMTGAMRDFTDANAMAKTLRTALGEQGVELSHSQSLELVARQFDLPDWNILAAQITAKSAEISMTPEILINPVIPVIRSFDEAKAQEFYIDYLGFGVDWKHRHAAHLL